MSIQALPPDVVAQIKSSTVITSLNGVVSELIQNSLDAGSSKINIHIDYARGGCTVEDDGQGILPYEFERDGGLGRLYHTSKLSAKDAVHGGRGTFLASVAAMALVIITSHHHLHRSHNTLTLHKSEVISRQIPSSAQQHLPYFSHGTRVTIRDLFGTMPVRVRQRAMTAERHGGFNRDWDDFKHTVVTLLLPWTRKTTVTVRRIETGQKYILRSQPVVSSKVLDISNICNILSQASYIDSIESSSWVSLTASTSKLKLDGTISLTPSPTRRVQFISLGIHPLSTEGQTVLHDEINNLFFNSAFGSRDDALDLDSTVEKTGPDKDNEYKIDGNKNNEPRMRRKAVERWPMFYINIQHTTGVCEHLDADEVLDDKANILSAISDLLKATILEFLQTHDFQPKFFARPAAKSLDGQNASDRIVEKYGMKEADISHSVAKDYESTTKLEPSAAQDMLGTSTRLPSFRRTEARLDFPFEPWSRVKEGPLHSKSVISTDSRKMTPQQTPHIDRPSKTPIPENINSRSVSIRPLSPGTSQIPPKRRTSPLISAEGDIIRRPFGDIPVDQVSPRHKSDNTAEQEQELSHNDPMVSWMNPITKTASLINGRTGLVTSIVPDHKKSDDGHASLKASDKHPPLSRDPSPWLASVLTRWDNPVFLPTEMPIPKVSAESQGIEVNLDNSTCEHSCDDFPFDFNKELDGLPYESSGPISKRALRNAEVISQVDKKFILIKLYPLSDKGRISTDGDGAMLTIVDQHAADERVRVEALMRELCMQAEPNLPGSGVKCIALDKPLSYILSPKDMDLLHTYRLHFTHWGIVYHISQSGRSEHGNTEETLTVKSLPPGIVERCKATPRLLIELIRAEMWKLHDQGLQPHDTSLPESVGGDSWVSKIRACPQGIIDMLNSRACRSAVMFNDEMSKEQCEAIISRLAECAFPFQCAHGRPSMVPLVDLGSLGSFGN